MYDLSVNLGLHTCKNRPTGSAVKILLYLFFNFTRTLHVCSSVGFEACLKPVG